MNRALPLASLAVVIAIVALTGAGCAPIPGTLPPAGTPAASVYAPAIQSGVSAAESPLQPAPAPTITRPETSAPTGAPAATVASPAGQLTLVGPVWQWRASAFEDGTVLTPGDPSRYTFQLQGEGNAVVQADCNFGAATYQQSGNSLSFDSIGTTKMACPPESVDSAFLAQLRNIASYTLEAGELVLTLRENAGTMRLVAAPAEASLTPEAAATAAPAATQPPSPAPIPTGTLPPTDARTAIAPTASPTPVLLGTPVPLPTVLVVATALPGLGGTNWVLASLTADGQALAPIGAAPITMKLAADGAGITGSTGCNDYRAAFARDPSGAIVVGPALTTRKACAANVMVQEVEFVDALLRARSYVLQGSELKFIDVDGNELLLFVRT